MRIQTYKECSKTKESELVKDRIVEKEDAHKESLLHLSAHLLLIKEDRIYCRLRDKSEQRYQGLWTTTLGTHVEIGETFKSTILKNVKYSHEIRWIGTFNVKDDYENELCGLYTAEYEDGKIPAYLKKGRELINIKELVRLINEKKTTPHLKAVYELIKRNCERRH
jgi:hypothetical protein